MKRARVRRPDKPKGKVGGRRPGAGRPKGSSNITPTQDKVRFGQLCRAHTEEDLKELRKLALSTKTPAAVRVSILFGLLDRGFGRPAQAHEVYGLGGGPIVGMNLTHEMLEQSGVTINELKLLDSIFTKLTGSAGNAQGGTGPEEGEAKYAATIGYNGRG